ncbi:hypothetical protein [Methylobacterium sp. D54C]
MLADTSGQLAGIARRLDVPVSAFFRSADRTGRGGYATPPGEDIPELIRLYSKLDTEGRATVLALTRRLLDA